MTLRGMFRLTIRETRLYVIAAGTLVLLALGPTAAARLNDHDLPGDALVIGFYAVGAAWIFYAVWHRSGPSRRQASDVAMEAEKLGFHYPRRFRMPRSMLALPTLSRVSGGEVTFANAFAGRIEGRSVIVFDRVVQVDGYTPAHTITCAATELDVDSPRLLVEPRAPRLEITSDGLDEVRFESDVFDRRYRVGTEDPRFATALIDQRMIEWLLAQVEDRTYAAGGRWVACDVPQEDPRRLRELLEALEGFARHVPRVVGAVYGPAVSS